MLDIKLTIYTLAYRYEGGQLDLVEGGQPPDPEAVSELVQGLLSRLGFGDVYNFAMAHCRVSFIILLLGKGRSWSFGSLFCFLEAIRGV